MGEEGGCRAANEKYSGKMGKGTERVMKEARRGREARGDGKEGEETTEGLRTNRREQSEPTVWAEAAPR